MVLTFLCARGETTGEEKDESKRNKCLAILLALLMMISFGASTVYADASTKPEHFKDVPKEAWYYDYVMSLAEKGVVKGYGDTGEFRPLGPVNREEAAKMTCLASKLDYIFQEAIFPDVDAKGEFSPYIAALFEKEAVQALSDGSFGPKDKVKRAEAARMIQMAFGLESSSKEVKLLDLPAHDAGLAKAIGILASNGVVKGYGKSHYFKPDGEVSRAEFSKMLCMAEAAVSVQKAEGIGTLYSIGQAQDQVDLLSKTQDLDSKAFLQERLETLAGSVNTAEPSDRDKIKEDVEWLREVMAQCQGQKDTHTYPVQKLEEVGARHGSKILWRDVLTGQGPSAKARDAFKSEDGQHLILELGQRPQSGYSTRTSTIVAHVYNDGWSYNVMFSIFTTARYDHPHFEWEIIWHY